ncbi:MAG TPA: hypothetical protein VK694_07075 [Verrucomicrobiae bacterium]|nr:hypothetical protein [Verrucomicrobiae bacterium]
MTTNTLNETVVSGDESQFTPAWDDEALPDSASEVGLIHQALDRFRDAPAGAGPYTEIHLVEGDPIVVVSPRDLRSYGATVGGHHSLMDEMRSYDERYHYPELIDFANKHGLTTETVKAKGWAVKREDGGFDLRVDAVRDQRYDSSTTWIGGLKEKATAAGFQEVFLTDMARRSPARERVEARDPVLDVKIDTTWLASDEVPDRAYSEANVLRGVVRGFEVEEAWVLDKNAGAYIPEKRLAIDAVQARVNLHMYIYEAIQANEGGYCDIEWNGKRLKVDAKYDIERDRRTAQLAIFFPQDYGEDGEELQNAIAGAFAREFMHGYRYADELNVVVSKSRSTIDDSYMLTASDVPDDY